jgi:hypothetical protein
MIRNRDLVMVQQRGFPYSYGTMPRPNAKAAIAMRENGVRQFEMVPVPSCRCCGEPAWENLRCTKHQDRNPCLVEGCTRSGATDGRLADDQVICGHHWRAYVPPRSLMRRTYNAHFRRAKRIGWTPETIRAFERFWTRLVSRIRRASTEGTLDERAIRQMFGWNDEG